MLYTTDNRLRELERFMQRVPNFPPRGHGIVIIKNENQCKQDCAICIHRIGKAPNLRCDLDADSCIVKKIRMGAVALKEVLTETLSPISYPPFQRRLKEYIREGEMNPMDYRNEKHHIAFADAVRKKNRGNFALISALYLLTAEFALWQSAKHCMVENAICFEKIRLHGLSENGYTLFCAAKDLYLGSDCLTISDLSDKSVVQPKMFALICNAMAIRRFGLGAIQFNEERKQNHD